MNRLERKLPFILAGLALLAVAGALSLARRPAKPELRGRAFKLPPPSLEDSRLEPSSSQENAGRMYSADQPMSLARFLDLVAEEAPKNVAEQFSYEFDNEPDLKAEWERAKKNKAAPAAEFLAKLGAHPKFRALLSKFDARADFKGAWAKISGLEEVDKVLNQDVPAVVKREKDKKAKESQVAAALLAAHEAAGLRRVSAGTPFKVSFNPGSGGGAARSSIMGGPAELSSGNLASGTGAKTPSSTAADSKGSGGGESGSSGSTTGGGSSAQTPGETNSETGTVGLSELSEAGQGQNAVAYLASMFASADSTLLSDLKNACDAALAANRGCDIYELCQQVGRARCRAACKAPKCTLQFPDPPPATTVTTAAGGTTTTTPTTVTASNHPTATKYGGNVATNAAGHEVASYAGRAGQDSKATHHIGDVIVNGLVIGQFYTNKDKEGGGVVRNAENKIIYTYNGTGDVVTCPPSFCPD